MKGSFFYICYFNVMYTTQVRENERPIDLFSSSHIAFIGIESKRKILGYMDEHGKEQSQTAKGQCNVHTYQKEIKRKQKGEHYY